MLADESVTDDTAERRTRWATACRVAELASVDPHGLGGVVVGARPGPALDRWLDLLRRLSGSARPWLRVPPDIDDDRLLGGLDIAATLAAGRPITDAGALARADQGWLVVAGSERLTDAVASRMARALDQGHAVMLRDGLDRVWDARFGLIAIEEGQADERATPGAIADRLAFRIDLAGLALADLADAAASPDRVRAARRGLGDVKIDDDRLRTLGEAAAAFGITSPRTLLQVARLARVIAACKAARSVDDEAAMEAAQHVFAHRARRLPDEPEAEAPTPAPERAPARTDDMQSVQDAGALQDRIVEAVAVALPAGLLVEAQRRTPRTAAQGGRQGPQRRGRQRGRPIGSAPGRPIAGARVDILATLRAAAPWQRLRRSSTGTAPPSARRLEIRASDIRLRRFEEPAETLTVFLVDASGSAALHRLGEAKGAVEDLLAESYVRRASVALVAFRGSAAEVVLPPTRALARARRALAGVPGGGGTPLASALVAADALVGDALRRGRSPSVVLLTDCRANVALDGTGGRPQAEADAERAARALAGRGCPILLIDTSVRPPAFATTLAKALAARTLALPDAGRQAIANAARALV